MEQAGRWQGSQSRWASRLPGPGRQRSDDQRGEVSSKAEEGAASPRYQEMAARSANPPDDNPPEDPGYPPARPLKPPLSSAPGAGRIALKWAMTPPRKSPGWAG